MTDEPKTDDTGATATATPETPVEGDVAPEEKGPEKLTQSVEVRDVGPCKKHLKVTVERADVEKRMNEKYSELVKDSSVPGFRPGKAPRRLIERQFRSSVGDQVKTEVLLASLEQLAEEHDIAPLSAPNIDPSKIEVPKEGPLVYEFEVEVRPQFDLPQYKGLKLRRPIHTFTEEETLKEERRILAPHGQIIPKANGIAELNDILVADATIKHGGAELGKLTEEFFRVEKQLAFKDGVAETFGEQIKGAKAGDTRTVDIKLSSNVANPDLQGQTVQAVLTIKDVKTLRMPELTHEFLHNFGVHSPEQFREFVQVVLNRRLEYLQRQSARQQVTEQISASATWELPQDLLARQARRALNRKIMEMRSDGIPDEEIAGRVRLLQQDIHSSTAAALKEHFVLQKIAEVEKIEVSDDDVTDEIDRLAAQANESPRRVRAKLEKEDMLESLAAEMIERKALDLILESAQYEDYPLTEADQPAVATTEAQAVPGELKDPTAEQEQKDEEMKDEGAKSEG